MISRFLFVSLAKLNPQTQNHIMKTFLKFTALSAVLLMLAGGLASCADNEEQPITDITGTWAVKALYLKAGELENVTLPSNVLFSEFLIRVPNTTFGRITGNTFHLAFEFTFEIEEYGQIFMQCLLYNESQLLIQLKQGVDAEKFADNSILGIIPKELLSERLNIWLFETDGMRSLDELISILSQDPNVKIVSRNNRGVDLRIDPYWQTFMEHICNTVKFEIINNELIFRDSQGSPLIVFINR